MSRINRSFIYLNLILIIYSLSTVISKFAAQNEFLSAKFTVLYLIAILLLFLYAIFWQQIIKKMNLTVAYSNKAVTVIWGMVWGSIFFKESITLKMILGAFIILLGVYLVVSDNE